MTVRGVRSAAKTPEMSRLNIGFSSHPAEAYFGMRLKGTRTKAIDLRFHV
jgi:hypothetical protein